MTILGAVDMGTNSTRLLVADVDAGPAPSIRSTLDRRMTITRLGEGVDAARRLAPEAVSRTLDVLSGYREVLDEAGVEDVRAVATSAARDASNVDEFLDSAAEVLGRRPEILSGEDEARASFLGATAGLDVPGPYLVVDIGGGSTELVVGSGEPEAVVSIDVGCVRLTEQFLHADPPAPEELSQAVGMVRAHLADVEHRLPGARDAQTLVGLAGTVTTVAAVEMGLPAYDSDRIHHFVLTRAAAEEVFRTLATEPSARRRENPGLDPGRVDVIVGGCAVLVTLMRHYEFGEMLVSEADILDGLVLGLASRSESRS